MIISPIFINSIHTMYIAVMIVSVADLLKVIFCVFISDIIIRMVAVKYTIVIIFNSDSFFAISLYFSLCVLIGLKF